MPTASDILNAGDAVLRREFGSTPNGHAFALQTAPNAARIVGVGLFDTYQTDRGLRGNNTYRRAHSGTLSINIAANPQLANVLNAGGLEAIPDNWLVYLADTEYAIADSRTDSVAWTLELQGTNP